MWMMVSRPLVILFGLISTASAALVTALPQTNFASDTLMYAVFGIIAMEAFMGVGCLVAGLWGPVARLLGPRTPLH